jgi:CheY-like chemotaxis protein
MSIDAKSILVIDDDQVSRELLLLLLQRQGHHVIAAESGADGLEYLRAKEATLPDVIMADLHMPGISGEYLARALRELCGSAPVLIAISGSSPDEAVSREYDAFLLKPFTMEQFTTAIAGRRPDATSGLPIAPGVLDQSVYGKLAASMSRERLYQLYNLCLDDALKRIAAMHQAVSLGDDASYRQQAHAIKGSCGMVGALELQRLASTMESNGLDANHVATLHEFPLACERLRGMLNAHETATM